MSLETLKAELRGIVLANVKGVYLTNVLREYENTYGKTLNYKEFGHPNVASFIESVPDVARILQDGSGKSVVRGIALNRNNIIANKSAIFIVDEVDNQNKNNNKNGHLKFGKDTNNYYNNKNNAKCLNKKNTNFNENENKYVNNKNKYYKNKYYSNDNMDNNNNNVNNDIINDNNNDDEGAKAEENESFDIRKIKPKRNEPYNNNNINNNNKNNEFDYDDNQQQLFSSNKNNKSNNKRAKASSGYKADYYGKDIFSEDLTEQKSTLNSQYKNNNKNKQNNDYNNNNIVNDENLNKEIDNKIDKNADKTIKYNNRIRNYYNNSTYNISKDEDSKTFIPTSMENESLCLMYHDIFVNICGNNSLGTCVNNKSINEKDEHTNEEYRTSRRVICSSHLDDRKKEEDNSSGERTIRGASKMAVDFNEPKSKSNTTPTTTACEALSSEGGYYKQAIQDGDVNGFMRGLPKVVEVVITHFEADPSFFWAIIIHPEEFSCELLDLDNYQDDFTDFTFTQRRAIVFYESNYFRCWVKSTFKEVAIVQMIDFGLTDVVLKNTLKSAPEHLWTQLPTAIPCQLMDMQGMNTDNSLNKRHRGHIAVGADGQQNHILHFMKVELLNN